MSELKLDEIKGQYELGQKITRWDVYGDTQQIRDDIADLIAEVERLRVRIEELEAQEITTAEIEDRLSRTVAMEE